MSETEPVKWNSSTLNQKLDFEQDSLAVWETTRQYVIGVVVSHTFRKLRNECRDKGDFDEFLFFFESFVRCR